MKRMTLATAAILMGAAFPAIAGPDYVAKIPLSGGFSVLEFYMERSRLPECEGAGSHPSAVIANLETPSGTRPYGTGCWIAQVDGNIWIAIKSFQDGIVRETVLHNSQLKAPGSDKPSPSTAPKMAATPERKKTYRVDMADTDVTLEDEPCKTGGKKASFTHKLYDIGGYGCWVDGGQHILVHWTQKKTLSGNIEPFDLHSKINRPADMPFAAAKNASDQPAGKAKELIARVDKLAYSCRDSAGEAQRQACKQVEPAMKAVTKEGWCWGPDDAIGADKRWIRCTSDKTKNQCQQLYQAWVFNQLLENVCSFNNRVALGMVKAAEEVCSSVSEQQLNDWRKDVLSTAQKDVDGIGLPEFCRRNKPGYDDIKAEMSRASR